MLIKVFATKVIAKNTMIFRDGSGFLQLLLLRATIIGSTVIKERESNTEKKYTDPIQK